MVRIVDFSPSSQAANLAALKERRASLDQAMVDNLKPQEMRSPWQGAAQLAQSAMLGLRQGNIARQEAGSRAELARIAAGIDPDTGPTMEQAAQIGAIDTDWGKALMEGALKSRQDAAAREAQFAHDDASREDTQAEGRSTLTATQGFTAEQNDLNRQAELKKQEIADHTAAGRQEDAQQATRDLAVLNGQIDAEKAKTAAAVDAGKPQENTAKTMTDWRSGQFGDPNSPEAIRLRDAEIAANNKKNIAAPSANAAKFTEESDKLAAGRFDEIVKAGHDAPQALSDIRRLADLGKQIGTGKTAEIEALLGPWAEMVGADIKGLGEEQAFQAITDRMAPQMRPEGSGATSNYDAKQFLSSLPSLGKTPEGNRIIIQTFDALQQHKLAAADVAAKALRGEMTWQDAEEQIRALPYPYEIFNQMQAAQPPPDQSGGNGGFKIRRVQ